MQPVYASLHNLKEVRGHFTMVCPNHPYMCHIFMQISFTTGHSSFYLHEHDSLAFRFRLCKANTGCFFNNGPCMVTEGCALVGLEEVFVFMWVSDIIDAGFVLQGVFLCCPSG